TNVRVKGLHLVINGKIVNGDSTFKDIDRIVGTDEPILQYSGLVVLKDKGVEKDRFAIAFDKLEATKAEPSVIKPDVPQPPVERECLKYDQFIKEVMPLFKRIRMVTEENNAYSNWK